jgi:hypothetical protein
MDRANPLGGLIRQPLPATVMPELTYHRGFTPQPAI